MGAICSDQIDECYSSPCLNDGRCIDLVNGYQCNCQPGTSGRTVPPFFPLSFPATVWGLWYRQSDVTSLPALGLVEPWQFQAKLGEGNTLPHTLVVAE